MSILQKILEDMTIEKELLDELDEEQKQILFCKMREEQIKRWALYEAEMDEKDRTTPKPPNEPKIRWLLAADGEPWVWVMGDHPADPSYDELIDKHDHEYSHKLAEEEAERLRRTQEEELKDQLRRQKLEEDRERSDKLVDEALRQKARMETQKDLDHKVAKQQNTLISVRQNLKPINREPIANGRIVTGAKDKIQREIDEQQEREKEIEKVSVIEKERDELRLLLEKEAEKRIAEEKARIESEIYQSLKEAHKKAEQEAETESLTQEQQWKEQERKAKEAEMQIREIAKKAREQHRASIQKRTSSCLLNAINEISLGSNDALKKTKSLKLPRPSKPQSRDAVTQWFLKDERPCGTGLDPNTKEVAPWFHGIIPRSEAESMLIRRDTGAFLVRVSERIWGFALSYRAVDKVKHFLIERIDSGYQLLGTSQLVHESLWDLITFHEVIPITLKDKELLREPAGQICYPPDYHELFPASLYSSVC